MDPELQRRIAEAERLDRRLGRYLVTGRLGEGGMGVVLEAWDPQAGERVAIKHLGQDPSPQDVARFEREARLGMGLDHPGIARIRDVGADHRGPYMVMDLIPGRTLREVHGEAGLPPAQAAQLLADVCDAVQAAHDQGIFHRDLKPLNVMVTPAGRPVVLDLGLAKNPDAASQRLTKTGTIVGTMAFMAPEQANGEAVDARTDVYALGATLYACLTGCPPFEGGNMVGLIHAVLTRQPPRIRSLQPRTPPELEAIVERAMAKEPVERYPTARALGEALTAFNAVGGPAPVPERRPRGLLLGALGLLVVAGGVGLAVAGRGDPPTDEPSSSPSAAASPPLEQAWPPLTGDPYAAADADDAGADRATRLRRVHALALVAACERTHPDVIEPANARLARAAELGLEGLRSGGSPAPPRVVAWVRLAAGEPDAAQAAAEAIESGADDDEVHLLRALLADRRQLAGRLDALLGRRPRALLALLVRAALCVDELQGPQALALTRRALALPAARGPRLRARLLTTQGLGRRRARDDAGAERDYREALRLDPRRLEAAVHLAQLEHERDPRQAVRRLDRVLATWPDYPLGLVTRGNTRFALGEEQRGLRDLRRAAQLDPGFFGAQRSLAAALAKQGDGAAALRTAKKAIALRADHPGGWFALAQAHLALQDKPEALKAYDECLRREPTMTEARVNRALIRHAMGRYAEAQRDIDAVIAARPDDDAAHGAKGYLLFKQEPSDLPGAEAALDTALRLRPTSSQHQVLRAQVRGSRGNYPGARKDAEAVLARSPRGRFADQARYLLKVLDQAPR